MFWRLCPLGGLLCTGLTGRGGIGLGAGGAGTRAWHGGPGRGWEGNSMCQLMCALSTPWRGTLVRWFTGCGGAVSRAPRCEQSPPNSGLHTAQASQLPLESNTTPALQSGQGADQSCVSHSPSKFPGKGAMLKGSRTGTLTDEGRSCCFIKAGLRGRFRKRAERGNACRSG